MRKVDYEQEVEIAVVRKTTWIGLLVLTVVVTWIFYYILQYFHTANLIVSSLSIATSFFAASLMVLRTPWYAVAYSCNDMVLVVLWILASMNDIGYISMVLCFVIFFVNDLYGFYKWKRMRMKQSNSILEENVV
ncbi:MAG: nicotinamide mononucleotide transporter family protein [Lachnospiraceae bacterium]